MITQSVEPDPQSDTPDEPVETVEITLRDGAKTKIF